ncbi:hypothetical protein KSP40_PGU011700 [Platanthera guangdongensis]|uniref:Uncharacterized protein n=1 Tax=Platanthera guangdongensis TaxID=2320717 RepID=A0ABR2LD39_9ASPA
MTCIPSLDRASTTFCLSTVLAYHGRSRSRSSTLMSSASFLLLARAVSHRFLLLLRQIGRVVVLLSSCRRPVAPDRPCRVVVLFMSSALLINSLLVLSSSRDTDLPALYGCWKAEAWPTKKDVSSSIKSLFGQADPRQDLAPDNLNCRSLYFASSSSPGTTIHRSPVLKSAARAVVDPAVGDATWFPHVVAMPPKPSAPDPLVPAPDDEFIPDRDQILTLILGLNLHPNPYDLRWFNKCGGSINVDDESTPDSDQVL